MSRNTALYAAAVLVFAAAACGPSIGAPLGQASSGLAEDKNGNPVYPDAGPWQYPPSTADTTNLLVASDFDYASHGAATLESGEVTLLLCSDHWPAGSAARAEVVAAADLYNHVAGTAARVTIGSMSHKTIAQLFPSSPTANFMDFVDNSTTAFPCIGAGDTATWAMNTCRFGSSGWNSGGTGKVKHFVISVNANNYTFDTNPASTDFPKFDNVAHEMGHSFGLNHTPDWPDTAAQLLLSTMQGNMPILPPHDRGYLRHFYPPTSGSTTTLNLVASPKVRLPRSPGPGGQNFDFADVNPKDLFLSGGSYLDCATRATPVFQAQWLNAGQVSTSVDVTNRFRIGPAGDEASSAKITVKAWSAATMPAVSQDRIAASVPIDESKLSSLSKGVPLELTFMVDRDGAFSETDEGDNVVSSTITLHASSASCP